MTLKFQNLPFYFSLFLILLFQSLCLVHGVEIEKELTLTMTEMNLLDVLKLRLTKIPSEPRMKTDLALLRWLRAKNLNIDEAEAAFKENLKWREANNIDSILDEDWSHFKEEFFFDDGGTDFSGRPVLSADISEWNVRNAVTFGQANQLVRYMIRSLESASRRVDEMQKAGHNVTQWQVILNMDNFNLVTHGCFQCLSVYVQFITAHQTHYPFGADKIIIINTPGIFEVVLRLIRPVMSSAMRDSLIVMGTNKAEWRKLVLSIVPQDQLAKHFGGTKISY